MAVKLSPIGNDAPFMDANGDPASGYFIYTYTAGSSTPQTTYTTAVGNVSNANPIELNAAGYPSSGASVVGIWLTEGVSYKFVLETAAGSVIWTRDAITGINDSSSAQDQWVSGPAPTYVSATSFTLVGDQTSIFHAGRRVRTTNSGGTAYSTIVTSTFGAVTTITLVNDSTTLDAGLSALSYGLLSATNPSTPLLSDAYPIVSGSADATKKIRLEADGITTATTRVITMPDKDVSLADATDTAGGLIELATQAEVNTGTDATRAVTPSTLAGRAGLVEIVAATAFPSANLVVVATSIPQTFASLLLVINGLSMDTASRQYYTQVSTNNGVGYDTTAANYQGVFFNNATAGENSAPTLFLMNTLAAANTSSVVIEITGYQAGSFPLAKTAGINITNGAAAQIAYVGSTSAVDALRIIMNSTGNFDAGTYALYGVRG